MSTSDSLIVLLHVLIELHIQHLKRFDQLINFRGIQISIFRFITWCVQNTEYNQQLKNTISVRLVYTAYVTVTSHVSHSYISAKMLSVFGTNPVDLPLACRAAKINIGTLALSTQELLLDSEMPEVKASPVSETVTNQSQMTINYGTSFINNTVNESRNLEQCILVVQSQQCTSRDTTSKNISHLCT